MGQNNFSNKSQDKFEYFQSVCAIADEICSCMLTCYSGVNLKNSFYKNWKRVPVMALRDEKARLRRLLADAIPAICRNGLSFQTSFHVEALIGITLDEDNVVLVSFEQTVAIDRPSDPYNLDPEKDVNKTDGCNVDVKKEERKSDKNNVRGNRQIKPNSSLELVDTTAEWQKKRSSSYGRSDAINLVNTSQNEDVYSSVNAQELDNDVIQILSASSFHERDEDFKYDERLGWDSYGHGTLQNSETIASSRMTNLNSRHSTRKRRPNARLLKKEEPIRKPKKMRTHAVENANQADFEDQQINSIELRDVSLLIKKELDDGVFSPDLMEYRNDPPSTGRKRSRFGARERRLPRSTDVVDTAGEEACAAEAEQMQDIYSRVCRVFFEKILQKIIVLFAKFFRKNK